QQYRGQGQPQQGHEYHPSDSPQSQGAPPPPPQGGHHYNPATSPTQGSVAPAGPGYAYHHAVPPATNPAPNDGHVDRERTGAVSNGPGGSAHLPSASMSHPAHQSHHQPLPRPSDLLHQQDQGPSSHHQFGQHRRQPSSPPVPMNGVVNHAAPAPVPSGIAASTDVLQQTRQDLQREVSHLSMLLGRAAAVLSGLDQALDSHRPGAGSPPVQHAVRESGSPGHGYLPPTTAPPPPPHGHPHGHSPIQPQSGAPSVPNDVTTNSALASLMALSSSGVPGRSGTSARHDERELQHLQPPLPLPPQQQQQQPPPPPPQQQQQLPPPPRYPQSYPLPRRP
ncbi:hypothetical protein BGX20_006413, partial [Mortierella sp. AD010]